MRHVFRVSQLDAAGAVLGVRKLRDAPPANEYVFDFSRMEWVEPFGLLLYASAVRDLRRRFPGAVHTGEGLTNTYAAHMGFFRALGLQHGNEPGEARGGLSYIPVTSLNVDEIRLRAAEQRVEVGDAVQQRADQLARVLTQNDGGEVEKTLTYSLREVLRNVLEHSNSELVWFAAQYWRDGRAVLAIQDEGVGIRATLAKNPHLKIKTFHDALRLAIEPGISGVAFKGARRSERGQWANSGYGLFMTSRLCSLGGKFVIGSGPAALMLEKNQEHEIEVSVNGTLLGLELDLSRVQSLEKRLKEFREEAVSRRQVTNTPRGPSGSMVARVQRQDPNDC